ncbi:hypothetical protein KIN20_032007 [Parelaphostrongylus tenuis]|uniref:Protein ARV n=1 Tax=Parelaphostrongylus tenuis TaxID=148309 RepID=A0AAD5WI61_PARTN|nr:hypothetical protein KIN20_032007 [Parelaphostrongylus tenuis]
MTCDLFSRYYESIKNSAVLEENDDENFIVRSVEINTPVHLMSEANYKCVNCMEPSTSLYQSYSEGVIRLSNCKHCNEVVDKYVEYETMLIVIDLIVHNICAYRHIIYNMKIQSYLRLTVIFLLCDAYDKWISGRVGVYSIYDLEWIFYKSFLQSAVEMVTYVATVVLCDVKMHSYQVERILTVSRGTIIGYYGNVAVVLSIIFRLSNEFSYRSVTQLFIFASRIQIQRTLFPDLSFRSNFIIVTSGVAVSMASGLLCRYFLEY